MSRVGESNTPTAWQHSGTQSTSLWKHKHPHSQHPHSLLSITAKQQQQVLTVATPCFPQEEPWEVSCCDQTEAVAAELTSDQRHQLMSHRHIASACPAARLLPVRRDGCGHQSVVSQGAVSRRAPSHRRACEPVESHFSAAPPIRRHHTSTCCTVSNTHAHTAGTNTLHRHQPDPHGATSRGVDN